MVVVAIVSDAKCQPLKQAVRRAGSRDWESTPSLESPVVWRWRVGGNAGGWVGGGKVKEECGRDQTGKFGEGRVKSTTVQMFPFLPPISSFGLCTLFFFSRLVSDLIWNWLLTCLSIVNNHTNVCQVFPTLRLRITWWVRGNSEGSKYEPSSQKWGLMKPQSLSKEKRIMVGGLYLYHCPPSLSTLWVQHLLRPIMIMSGKILSLQVPSLAEF